MSSTLFPPGEESGVRRITLVRLSSEIARSLATLGLLAVEGEVHRPNRRPGGTIFFTLRDRVAQVAVVCPAAKARRCRVVEGERARVTGRLTWNSGRGALQLEAEEVAPAGAGAVAAQLAEVRARLEAEGLVGRPRRPLPVLPAAIGVVCGAEAAVRADIQSVVDARFPGYPVRFREVRVSGPGAAEAMVEGLRALDRDPDVEVIVLARGGGDATELLPFSDEDLCRAVAACTTPVVSAVGHEGDRPLCDEVADHRCGTPSLAAALVVPDRDALFAGLDRLLDAARATAESRAADAGRRLAAVDRHRAVASGLALATARLDMAGERLALLHPRRQLAAAAARLAAVDLDTPIRRRLADAARELGAHHRQLEALSPTRVLERGYAVVRTGDGEVVRRSGQVVVGSVVRIELAVGRVGARVEDVDA